MTHDAATAYACVAYRVREYDRRAVDGGTSPLRWSWKCYLILQWKGRRKDPSAR